MEIDPADQSVLVPPVDADVVEGEQKVWDIERSHLEQQNFNLNQELADARERLTELSTSNARLLEELGRHGHEVTEIGNQRRILEYARNELTEKNINLESIVSRLKIEKEERDNAIVQSNKEKQTVLSEFYALREQIRQLSEEKSSLVITSEALKRENQSIAFEREKYASEREMYSESKRWFMNEVSERDNKVSNLRLELSNKDIEYTNERLQLEYQSNQLKMQIDDLTEKLDLTKKNNSEMMKRLEEVEKQCAKQVDDLEGERRVQDQLISVLRDTAENAKLDADTARDQLSSRDGIVKEVQTQLIELQEEIQNDKRNFEEKISEKDEEVSQLKVELAKAHELLKSKHAVNVNVTEEELAALSPAAADTARLLRGGQTLTGFVREQARISGELAAQKEENQRLMETLQELVDTLETNGPAFAAQKNVTDSVFDRNERFEKQLSDAQTERTTLINERDESKRELAFTQAELEKYQRDFDRIMKRNAELMYAVERQNQSSDLDSTSDEKLFTTIVSLQQRNVQLESDIEHEKASAAQAAMNAQNVEMAELRTALSQAKESETRLKSHIEQLNSALNVVKDQADHFKDLVRDSVSATEARNARIKAQEAVADKLAAEMKVTRLEDLIQVIKEERDKREKDFAERVEAAENLTNETKTTYVTLQCMLETQKSFTAELQQEIKSYEKEAEKAKNDLEKMMAEDMRKSQKLSDIGAQLMDAKEQTGSLGVRMRALEDELASARSEASYLRLENETHKAIMSREQQFTFTLNEMSTRLARVEAEKLNVANTQNEVVQMERDSLKASSARLADQLTHFKNEAKIAQRKLEQELEVAKSRLHEKDVQNSGCERELIDLRSKLASVQAQYIGADTTGMTPDRLKKEYQQMKNRNQFLQNQLDEVSRKLMEAETEKTKRDDESALVESHSNVLEENLKQAERLGALERERLEAKAKSNEDRAQELSDALGKVREEYEAVKMELDDTRCESERNTADLRRQLDILRMEIDAVQAEKLETIETVARAKNDVNQKDDEVREISEKMNIINDKLTNSEIIINRLQSQLDEKSIALINEIEAKKQADSMRVTAEHTLATRIEEHKQQEQHSSETMKMYSEKLEQLTHQYEAFAAFPSTEADVTMVDPNVSSIHSADVSQSDSSQSNFVASLQNLLQFVRTEKDNAIARAMNSEIEMKRLRAETSEFERGRNELLTKIRDLETERAANAAALVEKAKLIERVESLSNVQKLNAQLNTEKMQLASDFSQLQQMKSETDKKNNALAVRLTDLTGKLNSANQEAIQKKKEVEVLKQRLESSGRAQNSSLQTQLEQAKALLTQARQEASLASEQAKQAEQVKLKAEETAKQFQNKFNQTRQLAVKYRDELNILKKTTDEGAPTPSVESSSNAQVEKLKTDIEELQKQLSSKVSEVEMNTYRMNMLESRLGKMTEKLTEMTSERDGLMQNNMKLVRELNHSKAVSATDIESKPTTSQGDAKPTPASSSRGLGSQSIATPSPFSPSNAPPLASSTPRVPISVSEPTEPDQTSASSSAPGSAAKVPSFFGVHPPSQQKSTNPIPPAPASSSLLHSTTSSAFSAVEPRKLDVPSNIPTEPMDVIPPVPSETIPDPTPPATTFGKSVLPVPQTFQTSARVPTQSLFSSSSSSTTPASVPDVVKESHKKSVLPNIEGSSGPSHGNVTYSFATSTILGTQPGQQLFGKSGTPQLNISASSGDMSSDNMVLPEESVAEAAGQSSHVSGSIDDSHNKTLEGDLAANDGESRDSTIVGGVSSSDGRRKRPAAECDSNEPKRQRDSPNEAVTSSESRQQGSAPADIPELDDDVVLDMEQEVSDEDPNETIRQRDEVVLENDEEVLEDEMEGEEEDDESFGNDEEYEDDQDDSYAGMEAVPQDDEIIVLDSDDDNVNEVDVNDEDDDADTLNDLEDEGNDEEEEEDDDGDQDDQDDDGNDGEVEEIIGNDDIIEVVGGEDSQPSLEDQDREAASAMEEAEDEGRDPLAAMDEPAAPSDPTGASGIGSSGESSQSGVPRLRMPIGLLREAEREDQCSSSNESNEGPSRGVSSRNMARQYRPNRGAKAPPRAIYQARRGDDNGRGGRGGGRGRGGGTV